MLDETQYRFFWSNNHWIIGKVVEEDAEADYFVLSAPRELMGRLAEDSNTVTIGLYPFSLANPDADVQFAYEAVDALIPNISQDLLEAYHNDTSKIKLIKGAH